MGSDGDAYYIRAAMCAASIAFVPSDYDIFALAALRYVASGSTPTTTAPTSSDWSDSTNDDSTCYDWPDSNLVPYTSVDPPSTVLDSVVMVRTVIRLTSGCNLAASLTMLLIIELTSWVPH